MFRKKRLAGTANLKMRWKLLIEMIHEGGIANFTLIDIETRQKYLQKVTRIIGAREPKAVLYCPRFLFVDF